MRGLEVRSIAKSYDKRAVLHDVSLHVERGEVVGLLGPNGAGKTTSFYSVMGLVRPDAGRIFLDGRDITQSADVPPGDPRPWLSAAGNLDLPRPDRRTEYHGRCSKSPSPTRMRARRGSNNCSRNSASPICANPRRWRCRAASGGAAKSPGRWRPSRRSCCSTSRSPGSIRFRSADIRELVCELKQRDIGVLITDHNVRETLDIVDRACIIYDGQVLFEGTPAGAGRRRECAAALSWRKLCALARGCNGHGARPAYRPSRFAAAGDDPAAAAGDQAARAVQPRNRSGHRRGTGQESVARSAARARARAGEAVIVRRGLANLATRPPIRPGPTN